MLYKKTRIVLSMLNIHSGISLSKKYLFVVCLLLSSAVYAWDGNTVTEPVLTGNTYKIFLPEELAWIARQSASTDFEGYTIELQQSIDLGENCNWTPIGSLEMPFQGTFKGNCHAIANLNINYINTVNNIGLFGYIGTNGSVKELAVKSGKIYLDKKNYVGCIAGQNHGHISYCFNLGQIVADESDYVGSLTGYNAGVIDYCYNAGIISAAQNYVGGLTGSNNGTISNSYNIGYTKSNGNNNGAITGENGQKGVYSNVFYDLQMCLLHAAPTPVSGITILNTFEAISHSIFNNNPEYTTGYNFYPQLTCFTLSDESVLSIVSAAPLTLPNEAPMQRAENVSKDFDIAVTQQISWISPNQEIVELRHSEAFVHRPCQKQEIIISAVREDNVKKIYLSIEGYDVFNAGEIGGYRTICRDDKVKFADRNVGGEIRTASGGKNDDPQKAPYYYKLYLYECIPTNGKTDTVLIKETVLTQQEYSQFYCYTSRPGTFFYKREARDSQCNTDWEASAGVMFYEIMEDFDAGEISNTTDTIYGLLPRDTTILNIREASGGLKPYEYRWYLTQQQVNYTTGEIQTIAKDVMIQENREPVDTLEYRTQLTVPGEYYFTRSARDTYCSSEHFTDSKGTKHFVVFDFLHAGSIHTGIKETCSVLLEDTIQQESPVTGGNGRYMYRWLCNGDVIQGADSAFLPLNKVGFTHGETHLLQRQTKDDTGLMDWTLSEGAFTVLIYDKLDAGSIITTTDTVCISTHTEDIVITATEKTAPIGGDGELTYRWRMYQLLNNKRDSLDLLEYNQPSFSYHFRFGDYFQPTTDSATIILVREVYNSRCSTDWLPSDGEAVITIGKNTQLQQTVTVCQNDLPYIGTYVYDNGVEESFVMNKDKDTIRLYDVSALGCTKEVILVCKTIATPETKIEPIGSVCQGDSLITVYFRITSGRPNNYAITYSNNALLAGFSPIEAELTSKTEISVPLPKVPLSDYEMYIRFFTEQNDNICSGSTDTLSFSLSLSGYVYEKWNDVLYVDNNDKNGVPDAEIDMKFIAYQWYKNGQPIPGAIGQVYQEEGGLNGVYTVLLTDSEGNVYRSCEVEKHSVYLESDDTKLLHISPVPLPQGEKLHIEAIDDGWCEVFTLTGTYICRQHLHKGYQTLDIPAKEGIYLLHFTTISGLSVTYQLIIK